MSVMVGTPRITIHLEALTSDCTCPRLPGCGGLAFVKFSCSEHGSESTEVQMGYHTHAVQSDRVTRGINH